jgi:hypothetical protein
MLKRGAKNTNIKSPRKKSKEMNELLKKYGEKCMIEKLATYDVCDKRQTEAYIQLWINKYKKLNRTSQDDVFNPTKCDEINLENKILRRSYMKDYMRRKRCRVSP